MMQLKVKKGYWLALIVVILIFAAYKLYRFNITDIVNQSNENVQDIKAKQEKREQDFFKQLKAKGKEISEIKKKLPGIKKLKQENAELKKEIKEYKKMPKPLTLKDCITQNEKILKTLVKCGKKHEKAVSGNIARDKIIVIQSTLLKAWPLFYNLQKVDHLRIQAIQKMKLKKEKKKKFFWSIISFASGILFDKIL